MTKKCLGCGSVMQYDNPELEGYVDQKDYNSSLICRRCFRMKYYGEYYAVKKKNDEFIDIVKSINNTNDLVLYVVDLFTLSNNIEIIHKYLSNDILLVITKRDIMPKSINNNKLISYIETLNKNYNIMDTVIVSAINNEGLDELYRKIKQYQISKKVYVVGSTNAGKSTLVNKLVKNYSTAISNITASLMPSTTLNQINVELDEDLTLIDTPGIVDETSIINYIDIKDLKKITPKKEIKPITYQLNSKKSIELDKYARLNYVSGEKNSFTIYMSPALKVSQVNITTHEEKYAELVSHVFDIVGREDIVINGLGYIKITNPGRIEVLAPRGVSVIKRDAMV